MLVKESCVEMSLIWKKLRVASRARVSKVDTKGAQEIL